MTGGGIALASHSNITGVPTFTLNIVTEVPLWSLMLGGTVEEEQSYFCLSSVKAKKNYLKNPQILHFILGKQLKQKKNKQTKDS